MKKVLSVSVMVLVLALTVVSCASTNHEIALSQNKDVEGKNGIMRPDWVVYDMSNEETLYASGYGKGRDLEISLQKAKLAADSKIALWVSTQMDVMRERLITENTEDEFTKYVDQFTSQTKQISTALLTGVVEVDFWEDLEGGVWVLESVDKANIRTQVQSVIDSICKEAVPEEEKATAGDAAVKLNEVLDEILEK